MCARAPYLADMSDAGHQHGHRREPRRSARNAPRAPRESDDHLNLNDPRLMRVLQSIPAMQRWELLRRAQNGLSAEDLAQRAAAGLHDVQQSLDLLAEAGLVRVLRPSRRGGRALYRVTRERLIVRWNRDDPGDVVAWRAFSKVMRDRSRRIIDDAVERSGAERLVQAGCSSAVSVSLLDEDAERVREALRSVYAMLAAADQRARSAPEAQGRTPYHVAFHLQQLWEADLPMAEFFIVESGRVSRESALLERSALRILSPREHEIAELLERGMTRPDIARQLGLSAHTVASVSKAIYRKLGISSRAHLTRRLRQA